MRYVADREEEEQEMVVWRKSEKEMGLVWWAMEEEKSVEESGGSCGNEEMSSSESMLDGTWSFLWITVTREESMVSGDTSLFVPTGNKEDGLGFSRNWNAHTFTYPEKVSRDRSPRTVLTW